MYVYMTVDVMETVAIHVDNAAHQALKIIPVEKL